MMWIAIALACLLIPGAGWATEIAPVLGPGTGYLENWGTRDELCPGGILSIHTDGTYEGGLAWQFGGQAAPYYGAFAECFSDTGVVCSAIFDFSRLSTQSGGTMDVYVWSDGGGAPGAVISVAPGVNPGPISVWPAVSRHTVDIPDSDVSGPYWVGYWGAWPGDTPDWYIAADANPAAVACPRTNIAPGIGFPTGWNDVAMVWSTTRSIGIGALVQTPGELRVNPNPVATGPDAYGNCCWNFQFWQYKQNQNGPITKVVMTIDTPDVGIIPDPNPTPCLPGMTTNFTTQSVTWNGSLGNGQACNPTICFTKFRDVLGPGTTVTFTAYDASGLVYNPGPITVTVVDQTGTCFGGCSLPPPGMTVWLPLDTVQGSNPVSTRNLVRSDPAVVTGTLPTVPPAMVGGARYFGAASYLTGSSSWNPGIGGFTIAAWVRLTALPTGQTERFIVDDSGPAGSPGYSFLITEPSPGVRKLKLCLTPAVGPSLCWDTPVVMGLGTWYHVAVAIDRAGSNSSFFFDGFSVGPPISANTFPGTLQNLTSMRIGMDEVPGNRPFLGDIDEFQMFRRPLTWEEIFWIHEARSQGVCKTVSCTPRVVMSHPFLLSTKSEIWMCNLGSTAATDDIHWSVLGLPAAGSGNQCAIPGPTQISPGSGGPLQANPCRSSGVFTMNDPGVTTTQSACFRAKVVNVNTGALAYCDGSMVRPNPVTPVWAAPRVGMKLRTPGDGAYVEVPWDGEAEGTFVLVNLSSGPIDFPYRISGQSCCGDSVADGAIVLNHLPPGTPVEGLVHILAHDSTMVSTGISFVEHNPFTFYDVILQGDLDGTPNTFEDMSSLLAQSVELADPASTPDVTPVSSTRMFGVRAVAPNPSSRGTTLRFSIPDAGRVSAEVFDAAGRLVSRVPAQVVSAGETTLSWNGRSESGDLVPSGVYYVRSRFDRQGGSTERLATQMVVIR